MQLCYNTPRASGKDYQSEYHKITLQTHYLTNYNNH